MTEDTLKIEAEALVKELLEMSEEPAIKNVVSFGICNTDKSFQEISANGIASLKADNSIIENAVAVNRMIKEHAATQ
jgi:hypothetical protein